MVSEASIALIREEIHHYCTTDSNSVARSEMELDVALHSTIQNQIVHQQNSHESDDDDGNSDVNTDRDR